MFVLQEATALHAAIVDAETDRPIHTFEVASKEGDATLDVEVLNTFKAHEDRMGRFTLKSLQPGKTTVFVRAAGYALARHVIRVRRGSQTIKLAVPLNAAGYVTGVVRDTQGHPVPDCGIFVDDLPSGYQQTQYHAPVKVDHAGRFRIENLAPGTYTFYAVKKGYKPARQEFALETDTPLEVALTLSGGGSVTGTITLDGNPMTDAGVDTYIDDVHYDAQTNVDGT